MSANISALFDRFGTFEPSNITPEHIPAIADLIGWYHNRLDDISGTRHYALSDTRRSNFSALRDAELCSDNDIVITIQTYIGGGAYDTTSERIPAALFFSDESISSWLILKYETQHIAAKAAEDRRTADAAARQEAKERALYQELHARYGSTSS